LILLSYLQQIRTTRTALLLFKFCPPVEHDVYGVIGFLDRLWKNEPLAAQFCRKQVCLKYPEAESRNRGCGGLHDATSILAGNYSTGSLQLQSERVRMVPESVVFSITYVFMPAKNFWSDQFRLQSGPRSWKTHSR
jgi:hypothetical protein